MDKVITFLVTLTSLSLSTHLTFKFKTGQSLSSFHIYTITTFYVQIHTLRVKRENIKSIKLKISNGFDILKHLLLFKIAYFFFTFFPHFLSYMINNMNNDIHDTTLEEITEI